MQFAHPWIAWLALPALLATLWALARAERRKRNALGRFATSRLIERLTASVSPSRRRAKRILLAAAVGALLLALARPQWGWREEEIHRRGTDLLFAVDTSKSMLAQDVHPNRLARAKLAVLDLMDRLEGDRVGLIAFAGTAFLQCPLTLDHDAFRASLDALDANVIPKGGTDLAKAIREAIAVFNNAPSNQKILLLLTDGEDLEQDSLAAAREAARAGLRVFTIGVGTPNGELVPIPGPNGTLDFAKDPEGRVVKSRLDEKRLAEIARITGGLYQPLGAQGDGLLALYQKGLSSLSRTQVLSRHHWTPIERFPWFVGFALLLLATEWMLGDRRRLPRSAAAAPRLLGATALLSAAFLASPACAALWSADNAYREGRFQDALAAYRDAAKQDPNAPEIQFNLGASAYRTGDFKTAAGAFLKAAKTAKTPELPPKALYNLGNALYRVGESTEKMNADETIKTWEQAIQAYDQALKRKSEDADAKFNRDFVQRKLDALKKQSPPQQNGKKDQQSPQPQQQSQSHQKETSPSKSDQNPSSSNTPSPSREPPKPEPDQSNPTEAPAAKKGERSSQPSSSEPSKNEEARAAQPKPERSDRAPPAAGRPGAMSPEEAKTLLDGLKGDERKMPLSLDRSGRASAQEEPVKRDW
ncbi:MAG: VWA domain-containing protein [Verrucomicrobiae bacterium]|nr:VWA domain-containing protein [Verrucomicrobiae bacterium]